MQKTEAYHEAAIQYNEGLAEAAEKLAPTLEHDEVKKWCIAVGKQHRFHAKRHRSALSKLQTKQEATPVEAIRDGLDVPDPTEDEIKLFHEPVAGADVTAEATLAEPVLTQVATLDPNEEKHFDDGCVGQHQPLQESCEFYPKGT